MKPRLPNYWNDLLADSRLYPNSWSNVNVYALSGSLYGLSCNNGPSLAPWFYRPLKCAYCGRHKDDGLGSCQGCGASNWEPVKYPHDFRGF